MYIQTEETAIPKYPFEPDRSTGNPAFRIDRNDCVMNYRRSDFLVPHRKDYYFMALVKQGSSRHWIDTVPYVLKPNTFYYTVPNQVNLKEEAEPVTGMTLSFSEEFLLMDESGYLRTLPVIQNLHNGHELSLSHTDMLFIDDILEKIYTEYHAGSYLQQNMLLAYVKVLLIFLSRLYVQQVSIEPQPGKMLLNRYLKNINEHYMQRHEVAHYAYLMHISAGHLSEQVKEQSGKSAITHIHERLIVEAKRMLFHTDRSIKQIAFELGFEDASYFNRFFKRLTQYTPASYRSSIRKMYH